MIRSEGLKNSQNLEVGVQKGNRKRIVNTPDLTLRIIKANNGSAADCAHHTVLRNLFIPWTVSTRISGLAYDVNIPKGDDLPEVEQLLQGSRAISAMFLHI